MKNIRYILVLAVFFASLFTAAACESPTTITNDNDNNINVEPLDCGFGTEEINGECVAIQCDDGFELDNDGECVEVVEEEEG